MRFGWKRICVWIIISLLLELFVFNYKMLFPVRGEFFGWEDGWHVMGLEPVSQNTYCEIPDSLGGFEIENINDIADTLKLIWSCIRKWMEEAGKNRYWQKRNAEVYGLNYGEQMTVMKIIIILGGN